MKIKLSNISNNENKFNSIDSSATIDVKNLIGNIHTKILVYKLNERFIARGNIKYSLELTCDVCLEKYNADFNKDFNLVIIPENLFDKNNIINDEFIILKNNSIEIDFNDFIKETIQISIPIKQKCKPDCKGLCPICGKNKNYYECSHKFINIDPRFEKLKEIRKKINEERN